MTKEFEKFDLDKVKEYSINERKNLVSKNDFGQAIEAGSSFSKFFDSLPTILAGKNIKRLIEAIINARKRDKAVILGMGAHPIKCGTSPYIIKLLKKGIIDFIAVNGAFLIHDLEIALIGETSEDVQENLRTGHFGMAKESSALINETFNKSEENNLGIGCLIGQIISDKDLPFKNLSISACCFDKKIPLSVHVGIGTDINHLHPDLDGGALGKATLEDFKLFISAVSELNDGGVFINIGSAVIIPEVFLKALSAARSAGIEVENFTTANLDFIQHYRPTQNVIKRPTSKDGSQGIALTGHHEIMIPLITQAIIEHFE